MSREDWAAYRKHAAAERAKDRAVNACRNGRLIDRAERRGARVHRFKSTHIRLRFGDRAIDVWPTTDRWVPIGAGPVRSVRHDVRRGIDYLGVFNVPTEPPAERRGGQGAERST